MKPKFVVVGLVIAAALVYMIYAWVTQSSVYFVTPSELKAELIRVKKQLADTQLDRDILKKAAAYFAKESTKSTR